MTYQVASDEAERRIDGLIAEWSETLRTKPEAGTESLRILEMPDGRSLRFCVVGVTKSGKTSLMNAIFGKEVGYEAASAGTTDKIMRAVLPSGVEIYDTPGANDEPHEIEGRRIDFENITRQFLGIAQLPDDPAYDDVYVCSRTEQDGLCQDVKRRPVEYEGAKVFEIDYPTIPQCKSLRCKHLSAHEAVEAVRRYQPDVVLEVLAGTLTKGVMSFHRAVQKDLTCPVVVAQRIDASMTPQQRKEVADGARKMGLVPLPVDCKKEPDTVARVVNALVDHAPLWAKDAFNASLNKAYRLSRLQLFMNQVANITVTIAAQGRDIDAVFSQLPRIIRQLLFVWARAHCGRDASDPEILKDVPDFRRYVTRIDESRTEIDTEMLRGRATNIVLKRRSLWTRFKEVFTGTNMQEYEPEIRAEMEHLRSAERPPAPRIEVPTTEERAGGLAVCFRTLARALVAVEGLPSGVLTDVDGVIDGRAGTRSLHAVLKDILTAPHLPRSSEAKQEVARIAQEVAGVLQRSLNSKSGSR